MWSSQLQWLPGRATQGEAWSSLSTTFPIPLICPVQKKPQNMYIKYKWRRLTPLGVCGCGCVYVYQNQPPADELKMKEGKKKAQVKRKSKLEVTKEREDECFSCGDGGQIVSCKKPGCPKVYHADCLNLSKRPAGEEQGPGAPNGLPDRAVPL